MAMSDKISFPEWVKKVEATGQDKEAIAKDLRVTTTALYRYLSGERIPDRKVMGRILSRSGGLVDVAWFYVHAERAGAA